MVLAWSHQIVIRVQMGHEVIGLVVVAVVNVRLVSGTASASVILSNLIGILETIYQFSSRYVVY